MIKFLSEFPLQIKFFRGLLVGVLLLFFGISWGQSIGEFRSRQTGNWNEPSTWEQWDGTTWNTQAYEEIFPVIANTTSSAKTAPTGTTHTIALPSGIQQQDLILIFWSDANTSGTAPGTPTGFIQLYTATNGSRNQRAWYRIATGTESGSISVTAGAERSAHVAIRIQAGTYSGIPFFSTGVTSTNNQGNPGLLNPGLGINKFLWFAALHTDESSVVTAPANYGNAITGQTVTPTSTSTDQAQMVVASRELESNSEDPGSFNLNQSTTSTSFTIGVNGVFRSGPSLVSFPQSVFPTVVNTTQGAQSVTDATSHSINLPKSPRGDLLLVIFSADGNPTVNINTATSGNNWNKLGQESNGSTVTGAIFWKIAEGNDLLTLTTTAAERSSHIVYRIKDAIGISGIAANGSSTNSNPPLHTPSAGTRNYLWIATRSGDGNNVTASAAPTDFSNLLTQGIASNAGANTNSAIRQVVAASLDPGTFTSPNEQWVSYTLAVRGSGTASVLSNHTVTVTANVSVPDLTVATNGTLTLGNGLTFTSPGNGSVIVNGNLQTGTNGSTLISGTGTFTLSSGARLGITSADGITASGATGNIQVTGTRTFSTGANYLYNGSTNQTVGNGLPATVNSLIVANTGTSGNNSVSLNSNRSISSDLGVESGILDIAAFTANRATAGGNLYLDAGASLRLSGISNFPSNFSTVTLNCTSTVDYYATGPQTVAGFSYGNLILSGTGVKTLQAGTTQICSNLTLSGTAATTAVVGMTVGGNLNIGTGTTFSAGSFTQQVNGNWTNLGTFNAGTSTFNFAGSGPGTVTNTGTGSFFNLSFSGMGTKTMASSLSPTGDVLQVATSVILSGSNTLTLSSGKSMEINASGSLNTGSGRLILEPGARYINRGTSNPTLEARQQFTGDKGWRLIGSPVNSTYAALTSGFETQGFTGATNPNLQPNLLWWDETDKGTSLQAWRKPSNLSNAVPAGRGHYFYVFDGDTKPGGGTYGDALPITMSVTGTEVNLASGNFDFGVTFTPRDTSLVVQGDSLIEVNQADEGFNLIANPTASFIDFHAATGWTKTNIDQSIYIWDPATSAFLTWNGTSGSLGNGRIAPFQAFWIKTNNSGPQLRLNGNGAKSLTSTNFYRKTDTNPVSILEINVVGEGLGAQSFISFGGDGETGADEKDAYQLESLAEDWLLLYSFGSLRTKSPLVINHQPALSEQRDRVIPLHLAAAKKGEPFTGAYLMDWKLPADWDSSVDLVLMDHVNQKAIDMKKESAYAFEFEAPKATVSTARKSWNSGFGPHAVVFQTPYELGEAEILPNARTSPGAKPKRPFTLFLGSFPDGRIEYLPDFPKLFSPVPNPFADQTKIRFFLPQTENAAIQILDLLGQEVGGFPVQEYPAGIHELDWIPTAVQLPSGMYLIRLITSQGLFTQKLIKN